MPRSDLPLLMAAIATVLACGGSAGPPVATPTSSSIELSTPSALSRPDLIGPAAAFPDLPFSGGQVAPFVARWARYATPDAAAAMGRSNWTKTNVLSLAATAWPNRR